MPKGKLMRQLLMTFCALLATVMAVTAQQQADGQNIGYLTVAAALDGMRTKSGVNVSIQGSWTVIEDGATSSIWSFTPAGHPAHPAVVRRTIVQQGNDIFVNMGVLCEAAKPSCDKLVAEFQELNNKMRESLSRRRGP